jgi:hypothetical protein
LPHGSYATQRPHRPGRPGVPCAQSSERTRTGLRNAGRLLGLRAGHRPDDGLRRMRILAYCLMPNHWHFVLWPYDDGDLAAFMHRLTTTHVRRWHLHRHSVGAGHLYQGTFKSFPVQSDAHLLTVCRYVERNPVRARLVDRAFSMMSSFQLLAPNRALSCRARLRWRRGAPRFQCQTLQQID